MKVQLNVGRQAVSVGLLVVMLTWPVLAIVKGVAGVEDLASWPIAFTLAILLGWVASALYRKMEIGAVKIERRRLEEMRAPTDYVESARPFSLSPVATVAFGLFEGEDVSNSQWERKGPPYGWVPMLAGLAPLGAFLFLARQPWQVCVATLFFYVFAAGIENPWLARQMKEWPGLKDDSSTELVVPAILVAWAVIEFTIGTPLGVWSLWAAVGGYVAFCVVCIAATITDEATLALEFAVFVALIITIAALVTLLVIAFIGRLTWATPASYVLTFAIALAIARQTSGLPVELYPVARPRTLAPDPYHMSSA